MTLKDYGYIPLPATGVFIELGAKGVMQLATHLGIGLDDQMKYIHTNRMSNAQEIPMH